MFLLDQLLSAVICSFYILKMCLLLTSYKLGKTEDKYSSAGAAPEPQRKSVMMPEDTSRSRTLDPVGVALLHKSVSQHFMGLTQRALSMQLLATAPFDSVVAQRSMP